MPLLPAGLNGEILEIFKSLKRVVMSERGVAAFKNGFLKNHPIGCQLLGLCGALAVSNRVEYGLAIAAGVVSVLIASAFFISLIRRVVPQRIGVLCLMLVIAAFVTVFHLFLQSYFPHQSANLGPYVGLIITNCILLSRLESFSLRNSWIDSVADAFSQ
ncbi:MAG: hypothetical protein JW795_16750, partial [Chitinivibrionales bacterium]|nr:hypothetical protein [Chitinivibrionales bacterium]